jgi:hypothetical protein
MDKFWIKLSTTATELAVSLPETAGTDETSTAGILVLDDVVKIVKDEILEKEAEKMQQRLIYEGICKSFFVVLFFFGCGGRRMYLRILIANAYSKEALKTEKTILSAV